MATMTNSLFPVMALNREKTWIGEGARSQGE